MSAILSEEFRRTWSRWCVTRTVRLCRSAEKLGGNVETLCSWLHQVKKVGVLASAGVGQAGLEELRRMRWETSMKVEHEILRKAAACFGKELSRGTMVNSVCP